MSQAAVANDGSDGCRHISTSTPIEQPSNALHGLVPLGHTFTPQVVYRQNLLGGEDGNEDDADVQDHDDDDDCAKIKLSIQVHRLGTQRRSVLVCLEVWSWNENAEYDITQSMELDSKAIAYLNDPSNMFDTCVSENDAFSIRMDGKDVIFHLTNDGVQVSDLESISQDSDKVTNDDQAILDDIDVMSTIQFRMHVNAYAQLLDLIPTIKFIVKTIERIDRFPTAHLCLVTIAVMELYNLYNSKLGPESNLEKCYERIKPAVEGRMKLLEKVLLIPPAASRLVMRKYFKPSNKYEPSDSLVIILKNIFKHGKM